MSDCLFYLLEFLWEHPLFLPAIQKKPKLLNPACAETLAACAYLTELIQSSLLFSGVFVNVISINY